MRKLLVANWKENPVSGKKALQLFREIVKEKRGNADIVICPPFVYLEGVSKIFRLMSAAAKKNLALGVQDVFWEDQGAYTSEIGSEMVRSLGAQYVIIGHSERRIYAKETDAMINKKIISALKGGLHVILCVGESLAIRKKGMAAVERFIKNQLKKDLAGVRRLENWKLKIKNLAIAYEPIWAIGTGRNDTPEDAAKMAGFIKKVVSRELLVLGRGSSAISPRLLYGGSVNSKNVLDYVQCKGIDGALVGGASLKAGEFKKIINQING